MRLWLFCWLMLIVGLGCGGDDGDGTNVGPGNQGFGNGPTGWGSGEGGGTPEGGGGSVPGTETPSEEGGETPIDDPTEGDSYLGYPSAELGVVILGPTAQDSVSLQNGTIQVSGILFKEATSIKVSCSCGDVDASVGTFWSSPPLSLLEGDEYNRITKLL